MGNKPDRFAEFLANYGFQALIQDGSKTAPFIVRHPDDTPCLIVPVVSLDKERVTVYVFYGPKSRLSIDAVLNEDPKRFLVQWRKYCRAFVVARLSPRSDRYMIVLDYAATRRAAALLKKPYNVVMTPSLRSVDAALGTKLNAAHGGRWMFIDRFGEPLPKVQAQQGCRVLTMLPTETPTVFLRRVTLPDKQIETSGHLLPRCRASTWIASTTRYTRASSLL